MSLRAKSTEPSPSFKKDFNTLPEKIKKLVDEFVQELFGGNIKSSRKLKKLDGKYSHVYSARLNLHYRITFEIREKDRAWLRRVGPRENFYKNP
ncbi:MAG: hypothetical protein AABY83_13670 [Pseudomonadota bacterium]